jgi:AcrR family transcriptional regulator
MNAGRRAPDRRVLRTQRVLREALLSLIHEHGWDAVNVQAICERADVGRSTFYVHFADKEELLLSGFQLFRKELCEHVAASTGQPLSFLRPLIAHVREHQQISKALMGKRSHQAIQKEFLRVLREIIETEVAPLLPAGPRRNAVVRYLAGGLSELLLWWLDHRTGLDAAEVEQLALQLCRGVLGQGKAARERRT